MPRLLSNEIVLLISPCKYLDNLKAAQGQTSVSDDAFAMRYSVAQLGANVTRMIPTSQHRRQAFDVLWTHLISLFTPPP